MGAPAFGSDVFAGRFRIERAVGSGGMGTVYRALDEQSGQPVALKLLQGHGAPQEKERFAREASLLALLQHPYVVQYVAHGTSTTGEPFLAMEWLEGEDLAKRLLRGPLSLQDTLALAQAIGSALAAAHEQGITHRDIKPANIFLRRGDVHSPALLDFGIARRSLRGKTLTQTGAVVGTPEYMAPEQARGLRDVGPAADLFSLGCVLYECLAGCPPFIGEHVAAVLVKILFEDPRPIHTLRTGVPEPLAEIVARMLRKDVTLRLSSARAFVAALSDNALEEAIVRGDQALNETLPVGTTPSVQVDEQRLYSVAVLVPAPDKEGPQTAPTLTPQEQQARLQPFRTLREQLETFGTQLESLADGSIVATVPPSASAADQAMLAVRCALLMKERMPNAAVAVATGKGQLRDQIPIGEAVDRAFRLLDLTLRGTSSEQTRTTQDGVRLDSLSEHLLDRRFVLEERDGSVVALREQEDLDASRPLLGCPTPCVGREQELSFLESSLAACIDESAARAIAVLGEAGMGKSRLRRELLRRGKQLHSDITLLQGRSDVMSRGSPYATLSQAIRRLCEIEITDSQETQRQKLLHRTGRHLPKEEQQPTAWFLGEVCGVNFPSEQRQELQAARRDPKVMQAMITTACTTWLRAEATSAPVVLGLEDFHWADVLSAQILEQLLRECADLPLLVLVFSRPEARELFPSLFQPQRMQELLLRPLSKKACERFVGHILKSAMGANFRSERVGAIVQQSAGHPLLLEELIRAAASGQDGNQGDTVLALLQARLSNLDTLTRRIVRCASVFGEVFPDAAVVELLGGEAARPSVEASLLQLTQREFVERSTENRWPGTNAYRFHHALVREAAYALLTESEKRSYHAAAATSLIQLQEAEPLVIATHYKEASLLSQAVPWLLKAAESAQEKYDLVSSVMLASQALDAGPSSDIYGQLLGIQAIGLFWLEKYDDIIAKSIKALSLTRKGSRLWMQIASSALIAAMSLNSQLELGLLIGIIAGSAPDEDAEDAYCQCLQFLASIASAIGERASSQRYVAMIERRCVKTLPFRGLSYANMLMAKSMHELLLGSNPWDGYVYQTEAIRICERCGDVPQLIYGLNFLSLRYSEFGRFEESLDKINVGLQLSKNHHIAMWQTLSSLHVILICFMHGHIKLARDEIKQFSTSLYSNNKPNQLMEGVFLSTSSLIEAKGGSFERALDMARLSLERLGHTPIYALRAHEALMRAYVRQGNEVEANRAMERGLECLNKVGPAGSYELPFRLAVVETHLAWGNRPAAMVALREALDGLKLRANRIQDPAFRDSYLGKNPDNLRLRELARTLLGHDPMT